MKRNVSSFYFLIFFFLAVPACKNLCLFINAEESKVVSRFLSPAAFYYCEAASPVCLNGLFSSGTQAAGSFRERAFSFVGNDS